MQQAESIYQRLAGEADIPAEILMQARDMLNLTRANLAEFVKESRKFAGESKKNKVPVPEKKPVKKVEKPIKDIKKGSLPDMDILTKLAEADAERTGES